VSKTRVEIRVVFFVATQDEAINVISNLKEQIHPIKLTANVRDIEE